jgi:ribosome-associated heat shock protein Hsp15
MDAPPRTRLDKWLWAARFFKTRSLAADAIGGGKVDVNDERAKRSKLVQPGDEISVRIGPYEHRIIVRAISERRGSAALAAELYEETAASRAAREKLALQMKSMPTAFSYDEGRPSKKDRREINRLRDRR